MSSPNDVYNEQAKKFKDSDDIKRRANEVFIKWIEICSTSYDYSEEYKDMKPKALRKACLEKLLEFFNISENVKQYIIPHFDHLINMIKLNLFRPLPIPRQKIIKANPYDEYIEKISTVQDPAWPHLKIIYEIFLKLLICEDIKPWNWNINITYSFIKNLLGLLDNENFREQKSAQIILLRLYARLVARRKMIRGAIEDYFLEIIHKNLEFSGIDKVLEFLASIISGFAVPLREQHLIFFKRTIVKLFKVKNLQYFYDQLSRCCMMLLGKEDSLAIPLIEALLRYWPCWNSQIEVLFLAELQGVLSFYRNRESEVMSLRIFKRLARCLSSQHFQVAKRAYRFFESDIFLQILRDLKEISFPIFVPIIANAPNIHWHKEIKSLSRETKEILIEIDPLVFDLSLQNLKILDSDHRKEGLTFNTDERTEAENKWEILLAKAKDINPYFNIHIDFIQFHT